jgi:DNA-binding MarR family transcriptional regulator
MKPAFLNECLFFTTNRLGRAITKLAEEEFAETGLSPTYGYLLRLAIESPGATQKTLAEELAVAPSTLTRFVDKLEAKRLVERKVQGKTVLVYPTEKGMRLHEPLREASKRFRARYEALLGKSVADGLAATMNETSAKLDS